MLTNDQMFAVSATLDNVENLNNLITAYAHYINDGTYTLADVYAIYTEDFDLCLNLANEINNCFSWANISAYDIPQAIYNYLDEYMEDFAA